VEQHALECIFRGLNEAGVHYLVLGGLAVVAHGYARLTMDVDLVLSFDADNMTRAVAVFRDLDFRPRAPVPFTDFADEEKRRLWFEEKHRRVFSVWSP
jgi:hypothetical protein